MLGVEEAEESAAWGGARSGRVAARPSAFAAGPSRATRAWEAAKRMKTMLEACEPVFVAVSQLNRARMINPNLDAKRAAEDARAAMKSALEAGQELAEFLPEDPGASETDLRHVGVHRTLCHLVDDTAMRFAGPLRDNWKKPLSIESYGDQGWADLFFAHVETLLNGEPESTVARRQVMLRCLELGFVGTRRDEPESLKELMERLRESLGTDAPGLARLEDLVGGSHPIEEKSMDPPPAVTLKRWSLTVAAMVVVVVVAYVVAFFASTTQLKRELDRFESAKGGGAATQQTKAGESAASEPAPSGT